MNAPGHETDQTGQNAGTDTGTLLARARPFYEGDVPFVPGDTSNTGQGQLEGTVDSGDRDTPGPDGRDVPVPSTDEAGTEEPELSPEQLLYNALDRHKCSWSWLWRGDEWTDYVHCRACGIAKTPSGLEAA